MIYGCARSEQATWCWGMRLAVKKDKKDQESQGPGTGAGPWSTTLVGTELAHGPRFQKCWLVKSLLSRAWVLSCHNT